MIPYVDLLVAFCCALFYYRAAVFEKRSGVLWASLSVATWLVAFFVLGWGLRGSLALQILPFGAMMGLKIVGEMRAHEDDEEDA